MSASELPDSHHYVVVNFTTTIDNQQQALAEIGDYVADFLSQQPGFVCSKLLARKDGTGIVHQAEWVSEADFTAAGPRAREHPAFGTLMAYQPAGAGYQLSRIF